MSDDTRENDPGMLGNTVDGQTPGDGAGPRAAAGGPQGGGEPEGGSASEREEQKQVYITPDTDHEGAVGGTEGTTDGQ